MADTLELYELTQRIKNVISNNFYEYYSVIAEISSINVNRNGHCYLELIQKDENSENIIAKVRAIIWRNNFNLIKAYFESVTGKSLSPGIKILFSASVEYSELYGFSLNIVDIDPSYTLGDIERQRQETIKRLEDEGVFDMNKELEMPKVIKNVAIVSSETAAGYEDFMNQLTNNAYGFTFHTALFKAYMQGNDAEHSIIDAFNKIFENYEIFDVIVFIRGGGAKADLSVFDRYNIAYHITQLPLPVISGIGHDRDTSVADMVANTQVKTPTAAADFIVEHNKQFLDFLLDAESRIFDEIYNIIDIQKRLIEKLSSRFRIATHDFLYNKKNEIYTLNSDLKTKTATRLINEKNKLSEFVMSVDYAQKNYFNKKKLFLEQMQESAKLSVKRKLRNENHRLKILSLKINEIDPKRILEKGYTYTTGKKGKLIKSVNDLTKGDVIITHFIDGTKESEVK